METNKTTIKYVYKEYEGGKLKFPCHSTPLVYVYVYVYVYAYYTYKPNFI